MTILEFVMLPSASDIYHHYAIPNNHIFYSIILKQWINLIVSGESVNFIFRIRFLSFLFSCGIIAGLFTLAKRRFGLLLTASLLAGYIFSWQFNIYGCSIRGYVFSALMGLIAFGSILRLKSRYDFIYAVLYFSSSIAAVATIPSNLILFTCLSLFLFITCNYQRNWKIYLTVVSPLLSLLFYVGIFDQFINIFSVKRGWENYGSVLWHMFGGFGFAILPLFLAGIAGVVINISRMLKKKKIHSITILIIILALIPLLVIVFSPQTPYPRVFLPFFPIWIFVLVYSARDFLISIKRKYSSLCKISPDLILLILVLVWSFFLTQKGQEFSRIFTPANQQDDLIMPYYIKNFSPDYLVYDIKQECAKNSEIRIFIYKKADPISLIFMSKLQNVSDEIWVFDRAKKKIKFIEPEYFPEYTVARSEKDTTQIKSRFNLKGYFNLYKDYGFQKLYKYYDNARKK